MRIHLEGVKVRGKVEEKVKRKHTKIKSIVLKVDLYLLLFLTKILEGNKYFVKVCEIDKVNI